MIVAALSSFEDVLCSLE